MPVSLNTIFTLPGYHIFEEVYLGSRTVVYRGISEKDQLPVIIKLMRNEYPTFNEVAQFRNQYTITKNLNLPGVVKTYSLENYRNGYALVMEDFGGVSLQDIGKLLNQQDLNGYSSNLEFKLNNHNYLNNLLKLNNKFDFISCFLHIAIAVTAALDGIHRNCIIHKDIKPANILINPTTFEVKIIDFSIASLLPKEVKQLTNPDLLEGTLAYLSPEQTGRMNRALDYRTDFYSLGVTFYELLTGVLPFTTNDPIELIYCHLAKLARPIQSINPNIPSIICEIVNKLMAKNAEARYQSALGLKHDLEVCFCSWQEMGRIVPFELAQKDISDHFLISEKLYGRETDVETLLAAFERISTGTQSPLNKRGSQKGRSSGVEMVLVTGFSGVGKTAVVNEVHKPIVKNRGYFIKGKFDQFQRDIPFAALVQAFRDLIGQLLSESETKIERWKAKILAALGEQAQVIIDIIPELEIIIGSQPPVSELFGSAAQNRFNLLFQKFIYIFAVPEHPLVIFIDDLQWADAASLKLIQLLMSGANTSTNRSEVVFSSSTYTIGSTENTAKSLLLIGAYRNNEVDESHPLNITIKEIPKTATVNYIKLEALNQGELNRLIADTLHAQEVDTTALSQMVFAKTKGNPFFVNQFLKYLYNEKAIQFNCQKVRWEYELDKVKALSFTDDVVEFMAKELEKLPAPTQSLLRYAACIGNEFDLETLAIINQESVEDVTAKLWDALLEGLIIPKTEIYNLFYESSNQKNVIGVNNNSNHKYKQVYKFVHDRVQQAAYSLISQEEKQSTHLKIGNLLLTSTPISQREEKIFELVKQFNVAINLILDQATRDGIAEMNLTAGRRAMISTAYSAALNYLTTGIDLLAENAWEAKYKLTLALYETAAEAAYLSGEFERAEKFVEIVLAHAKILFEKIKVYKVRIEIYKAQCNASSAIKTGLKILDLLNVKLSENPNQDDIGKALQEINLALSDKPINDLINLPEMVDEKKIIIMGILERLLPITYTFNPNLFILVVVKQVYLSVAYGNSASSALSYGTYAIITWSIYQDINSNYQLGQLALKLLDKFNAAEFKSKVVFVVNIFTIHWKEHLINTLKSLIYCYQISIENGDIEQVGYSTQMYCDHSLWVGKEIGELGNEIIKYNNIINNTKQQIPLKLNYITLQTVLDLLGKSEVSYSSQNIVNHKKLTLSVLEQEGNRQALFYFHLHNLFLSYIFNNYLDALESAEFAQKYIDTVPARYIVSIFYFYSLLAMLSVHSDFNEFEEEDLNKLNIGFECIKKWSEEAPMNFLHKYHLLEAEKHRVMGNRIEAIDYYEQSICLAKEYGYINEEALANELASKFYLAWGKEKIAQTYMTDAYYCYVRWGTKAKADDLLQRYPQLLAYIIQKEAFSTPSTHNSNSSVHTSLYTSSTISSNQTILSSYNSISKSLDVAAIIKASQALSEKIEFAELAIALMQLMMENSGASKCALILSEGGNLDLTVTAVGICSASTSISTKFPLSNVNNSEDIPISLINYIKRSKEILVYDDARDIESLAKDKYIIRTQPKSLLCMPILNQGKLLGILYLENNVTIGAFTHGHIQILNLLTTQAAISLENARLYKNLAQANQSLEEYNHTLEEKVEARTCELNEKNLHLKQALDDLQNTQTQLIQSEKMSSLGQMIAGIAHEINNPINFIHGNITHANNYINDLLDLVVLYQKQYSPTPQIQQKNEEIDFEFLSQDLKKLLDSMKIGSSRIRDIVLSLRNFSRLDEAEMKPVDIHEGIENTLLILQHRLKEKSYRPEIQVIRKYTSLPKVNCYAGQLNQAFMNILNNAVDALDEVTLSNHSSISKPTIKISTVLLDSKLLKIEIADNGFGIKEEIKQKIFDPFFTTKPIGSGTGLGLSISYQIIVDKHKGQLTCGSNLGEGTIFTILIPT